MAIVRFMVKVMVMVIVMVIVGGHGQIEVIIQGHLPKGYNSSDSNNLIFGILPVEHVNFYTFFTKIQK